MNEIVPKRDRFEKELKEIERLQSTKDEPINLKSFETQSGLFGLMQKKVTGAEMNEYSVYLGQTLSEFNTKINKFYLQFKGVYGALESLDKEYLAGIVGAYNEAVEAFKKAEKAQKDVDRTIDNLKAAVEHIGEFNRKVNSELERLDSKNWKNDAIKHQEKIDEIDDKAHQIIETINGYKEAHSSLMNKLEECRCELDKYKSEKKRTNRLLLACGIVTGFAIIAMVVLILLIRFNVV